MKSTLLVLASCSVIMSSLAVAQTNTPGTVGTKIARQVTEEYTGVTSKEARLPYVAPQALPAGSPPAVKSKIARQLEQNQANKAAIAAKRDARRKALFGDPFQ